MLLLLRHDRSLPTTFLLYSSKSRPLRSWETHTERIQTVVRAGKAPSPVSGPKASVSEPKFRGSTSETREPLREGKRLQTKGVVTSPMLITDPGPNTPSYLLRCTLFGYHGVNRKSSTSHLLRTGEGLVLTEVPSQGLGPGDSRPGTIHSFTSISGMVGGRDHSRRVSTHVGTERVPRERSTLCPGGRSQPVSVVGSKAVGPDPQGICGRRYRDQGTTQDPVPFPLLFSS